MILLFVELGTPEKDVYDFLAKLSEDHYVKEIAERIFITNASIQTIKRRDTTGLVQSYNDLKDVKIKGKKK